MLNCVLWLGGGDLIIYDTIRKKRISIDMLKLFYFIF